MGLKELRYAAKVDLTKDPATLPYLHNRWHPDIPNCGTIKNGEVVKIECVDWTGGQIGNNDSADDVKNVDLTKVHYLTGPFEIETAEPGDVLVVEIQDVQPLQDQPWGFTGIFAKENGGGFLDDMYPKAAKAIWDFEGIFCSSRHIPGVRFAGLIHPGILGCAPSPEVLSIWNKRESELITSCSHMDRVVALAPQPVNVHAGTASGDLKSKIGQEGARTIPGRPEHGGNCDIKNLSRGSKVFLPVHVPGAKFSCDEEWNGGTWDEESDLYSGPCGTSVWAWEIPNACTTMGLPMDIFDFDISPGAPVKKIDMGTCAFASD
ncbi:hypothetical protein TWF191_006442 [Orbilia oligospora]|uniref:Formamidase n=1 Tax=Orbilia oligospora TaxID=2813651 RepID=A0A7C8QQQ1_ORBOL|nr:hypothetical protein TWF191_006442 [Orbilia oligospora]